jgi:DNA-binding transcriptional LysR family regulator
VSWEFERNGKVVRVEPSGPLLVRGIGAVDFGVDMAIAGVCVIHLFEDYLRPHLVSGALEPILEDWWQPFSGPFLYYSGRRLVPAPLRAFIDFIKATPTADARMARTSRPAAKRRRRAGAAT